MRHGLAVDAASAKMRVAQEKGREVVTAAQAERARLRQVDELRKNQEFCHELTPAGNVIF